MAIRNIQLFSIPVSDQDRSLEFYVGKLGFTLISDQRLQPDMRWVLVAPPGAQTAMTLVTWFDSMPAGSVKGIVLETDDLDDSIVQLTALGVETTPIQDAPWGRYTQLDDPDGNGLILQASTGSS
jgi:catechol 2,3-dioxygenase-like lactoylglutathione lyase family enzyme